MNHTFVLLTALETYCFQTKLRGKLASLTETETTDNWRDCLTPIELEAYDEAKDAIATARGEYD